MKKSVYFFQKTWYTIKTQIVLEPPSRGLNRAQVHSKNDQGAVVRCAPRNRAERAARTPLFPVRSFPRGVDRMLTQFLKIHKE